MSGGAISQSEKMSALVHLAGEVAHELNNIFTAVTGNLSLLSEEFQLSGTPAGMIDEISRTAQRGILLSQKLQAFAGRQPMSRKPVDVCVILRDCVRELADMLPSAIRLSLVCAEEGSISFVDEDQLRRNIRELAANAVTAMQGEGKLFFDALKQQIGAGNAFGLRPGGYVRLRVSDSGPGMAPDVAARALDPLFSTRAPHIGTGWGLSNCAGFARQSGGCMQLLSASGSGTVVELYLPLIAAPLPPKPPASGAVAG